MNPTIEKKEIHSPNKVLQGVLSALEALMSEAQNDFHTSNNLLSLGMKDTLAHTAEQMINNPLVATVDLYNNFRSIIWKNLEEIFDQSFVKDYSVFCSAVYKLDRIPESLLYYIILNDNSEENQDLFTDLIYDYTMKGPGHAFPIKFVFVQKEQIENLKQFQKILPAVK